MPAILLETDRELIDIMRRGGIASIHELGKALSVTATAVRQRLNRLMAEGLVDRKLVHEGRGRPSHHYALTIKGREAAGTNYNDLVAVLWAEVRAIDDRAIRAGLLKRLASRLAERTGKVEGDSLAEKMSTVAGMMGERSVPFEVDMSSGLPVLTALACPYPELAEIDRSICSVEKMLFSEMLGERVRLTDCRLEGAACCTFTPSEKGTPSDKANLAPVGKAEDD